MRASHEQSNLKIIVRALTKAYQRDDGTQFIAISGVNLSIREGEFVCILGKSGCGKTTLLNILAGFIPADQGEVLVDGKRVTRPGDQKGVVFQEFAVFPWLTVIRNVEFGLWVKGLPRTQRLARAREMLDLVNLERFEDAYPYQLSGGMQQRVAIARALATDPTILLMDEPFGSLDDQTRTALQTELLQIWEKTRKTIVFVTHSIPEAIILADRVVVMGADPGRITKEFRIDLPRPRGMSGPAFGALYESIQDAIRE